MEEPACKPDPVRRSRGGDHLSRWAPERPSPARSPGRCGLPDSSGGPPSNAACLTLLRVGLAEPRRSPGALVGSYPTVSPLPPRRTAAAVCSLLRFREVAPARLTPAPCPVESGLSSSRSPRPPGRLLRRRAYRPVSGPCRGAVRPRPLRLASAAEAAVHAHRPPPVPRYWRSPRRGCTEDHRQEDQSEGETDAVAETLRQFVVDHDQDDEVDDRDE